MKRVLIAGLFHETHTFLDAKTELSDFAILRDDELFSTIGDASPMAGVMEFARDAGWNVVPAIDYRATPSATVTDEVVEAWWREFEARARDALREPLDGLYLVLHGAMVSESLPDVEDEVLGRIRAIPGLGTLPIGGVTDLHGNFSPDMARHSNALVTYRKNPHTDAKEAAVLAAKILDDILEGNLPAQTVYARVPVMWPPTGTGTADEPMLGLENMARKIEANHADILAVNVYAGFSFADTPDTGVTFTAITTGDAATAEAALQTLCDYALTNKALGNTRETPVEEQMERVLELAAKGETPIILVEPSDNVGGGAPGDSTGVLRALLKHKVENSAVVIADPAAVEQISTRAIGEKDVLSIGGKGSSLDEGPVEMEVELVSTSDGKFDLEDPHSHLASMYGLHIDMGSCAVVKSASGVFILLTSLKMPPMDLGQLRSQGLIPEKLDVIGVKAAVAHRRAFDPIAAHQFWVGTPGPCTSDLNLFPFKRVKRPVYPLDD